MRIFRALRQVLAVAAAVVVTSVLASCAPAGPPGGTRTTTGNGRVITLNTISTLKSLFNHDDGHTRLIVIFSPT